jgi:hypothetical protein
MPKLSALLYKEKNMAPAIRKAAGCYIFSFLALCCLFSSLTAAAGDGEIQLMFPDNNVSSAPIVTFSGRRPVSAKEAKEIGRGPSTARACAGHFRFTPNTGSIAALRRTHVLDQSQT